MKVKQYRKKPVIIEAVLLTKVDGPDIAQWCNGRWMNLTGRGDRGEDISCVLIKTLEGEMRADLGDYVIKGLAGEFYPCKPDIFTQSYEEV